MEWRAIPGEMFRPFPLIAVLQWFVGYQCVVCSLFIGLSLRNTPKHAEKCEKWTLSIAFDYMPSWNKSTQSYSKRAHTTHTTTNTTPAEHTPLHTPHQLNTHHYKHHTNWTHTTTHTTPTEHTPLHTPHQQKVKRLFFIYSHVIQSRFEHISWVCLWP